MARLEWKKMMREYKLNKDIPERCAVCNCRDSFIQVADVVKCDVCGSEFVRETDDR